MPPTVRGITFLFLADCGCVLGSNKKSKFYNIHTIESLSGRTMVKRILGGFCKDTTKKFEKQQKTPNRLKLNKNSKNHEQGAIYVPWTACSVREVAPKILTPCLP